MSPTAKKFREENARLCHLPCSVPGCTKNRLGVTQYCSTHAGRAFTYGHPQGIPIPRRVYANELHEVKELFADYQDHPGLVSINQWLDNWIEEASKGEAETGNKLLGRIAIKRIHGLEGLSAVDLVAEVVAVWLFSRRYPSRLPDDQRLTFALSRNLARTATFEKVKYGNHKSTKNPPTAELRGVGERIRQSLPAFVINVEESLKRKTEKAKDFRTSLSIPFE